MECFTWIPHFWEQFFGNKISALGRVESRTNQVVATFPDDVISNILCRLPADQAFECRKVCKTWRALISTPTFIDMNLKRSTPILFMRSVVGNNWYKFIYFFVDEHAKNMMCKRFDCKPGHAIWNKCPSIEASCNGLLMFRGAYGSPYYFICNPVNKEHHLVSLPCSNLVVCGFFYNSFRGEYCILVYQPAEGGNPPQFLVYSISSQVKWRQLGNCKHCPSSLLAPSNVNGALHWMTYYFTYGNSTEIPCEEAIFIFNMKDENFSYRPHPGLKCNLNNETRSAIHNQQMRLLEIDHLSFCRIYPDLIDIWVLRDYDNWVWDKSFKVKLNFMRDMSYNIFDDFKRNILAHNIVHVQNGELLIIVKERLAFQYHITRHTIRKVYLPIWLNLSFSSSRSPITYNKSLVLLSNL